jgi:hypothetical protein
MGIYYINRLIARGMDQPEKPTVATRQFPSAQTAQPGD